MKLLEETKVGRNINRHYYEEAEIAEEVKRPVVAKLLKLMEFRNSNPAFNGSFELKKCADNELVIRREYEGSYAELHADFADRSFTITYAGAGEPEHTLSMC